MFAGPHEARLAVHRLDGDGRLADLTDVVEHKGSGPVVGRQEGTHAHQVISDPAGRCVLATDLGADTVFTYQLDSDAGKLKPGDSRNGHPQPAGRDRDFGVRTLRLGHQPGCGHGGGVPDRGHGA